MARLIGAVLVFAVTAPAGRPASALSEYQLKALFLFQLSQFVAWPAAKPSAADAPFVMGLLGDDPFGPMLDDLVRGETAAGRPITVRRISTPAEARSCQIVFVVAGGEKEWLATALEGHPVLTVGESDLFSRQDGMIRFNVERNRVRILINLLPVQRAGLTINSKLLRVADKVEGPPK